MANQHNNISFAGNVVADGRVLGENTIAFKVAQNQYDAKATENQHTNWFQCYWYQKDPTKLVGAFRKGSQVMVSGSLRASSTEKDGKSYHNLDIRVTDVVLPPKDKDAPSSAASAAVDDDIPF